MYRTASLRDDVTYRISGTLGNAAFMSLEFFDGETQAGSLLAADLRPDPSGQFEILLGPAGRDGHWLEIVPGTSYLLCREFFGDWDGARPSELRIECLDAPPGDWPVLSADRVAKELEALGGWLVEAVRVFAGAQAKGIRQFTNQWDPDVRRPASDLPPSITLTGICGLESACLSRSPSRRASTGASTWPTACGTRWISRTGRQASTARRRASTRTGCSAR